MHHAVNSLLPDPTDVFPVEDRETTLSEVFSAGFLFFDENGKRLNEANSLTFDNEDLVDSLLPTIARECSAEFIGETDDTVLLAISVPGVSEQRAVAVAPFVIQGSGDTGDFQSTASLLRISPADAQAWYEQQKPWDANVLFQLARMTSEKLWAEHRVAELERDVEKVSVNIAATYEEISLVYAVTRNLRLSRSETDLGQIALKWLSECLPAEGLAILLLPVEEEGNATYDARTKNVLVSHGKCPLDEQSFSQLVEFLNLPPDGPPYVANRIITDRPEWPVEGVHEVIVAPLTEGKHVFGYLAGFNRADDREFGTVEASLVSSIATLLGVHSGNRELYRQQAELLASVVRALTSAIDAKDPYTCGHSDRVARVAVRLAKEFGYNTQELNTIYMAGLLHDIGKIGIDDNVLRKPGILTDAEFQHIKLHPELGHKILADIKQLAEVLPVVLHHHEQWDGSGYPQNLEGEDIPKLARIVAVADAFDAMTSARPYRRGMADEKVDRILREGRGQQWDADVIDAFFNVREDIHDISLRERANLSLDVQQWT